MTAIVTAPETSRHSASAGQGRRPSGDDSRARLADGVLLLACVVMSLGVYLPIEEVYSDPLEAPGRK